MTTVKQLRKEFPFTFKAIDELAADRGCYVHPHYIVPDGYAEIMRQAESAFKAMASVKLGDVISLEDVKAHNCDGYVEYAVQDYNEMFKYENALAVFVCGEATFIDLLEIHYGDAGSAAQTIMGQVFDGELSEMLVF